MTIAHRTAAAILLILLALPAADAQQREADLEAIAQEISETTMSPFCPGRTLSACPSGQARALRGEIESWLAQGSSPEAVRNRLLITYGQEVRGVPRAEGVGLMAWIVPAAFVVVFFLLVVLVMRRLRRVEEPPKEAVVVDPQMRARVEEEMKLRLR